MTNKMKHTQKQLEAMSDYELSKIIAMMSKYSISFDINRWANMGILIDECSIDLQHDQLGNGMHFASDGDDVFVSSSPNIKRAAAIVYILIKQGE